MKKILRINMKNLTGNLADVPKEYQNLGGRGLTSTLIANEVNPLCHPLGSNNHLVIAPGILTGTTAPCTARVSVGAKSPLTGGIKESNCGGISGQKIARLGLAAIVIEDKPTKEGLYLLYISKDGVSFQEAGELKGAGNYKVAEYLREQYGERVGIISIGPAGEMLMSAASVAMIDRDGIPARHAARGGMGAVMGSKSIKAIVLDDTDTPKRVAPANKEDFNDAVKCFAEAIRNRPRVKEGLSVYGTTRLIAFANEVNSLPTRNFSTGQFEGVTRISGEALADTIDARGGERGHTCYPGCIVRCSNIYKDKKGGHLTSSLEYETVGMLGSNCGIDDLDVIAMLDRLCDDYGLDTIEMGGAIGVAMEAGVLLFGDGERTIEILHEVGKGTPLGRIIGNGVVITGRVFGMTRVPAVKGQGIPAWDPRTAMGTGLTIITSPQGADHNAGRIPGIREFDFFKPGAIAPLSLGMQLRMCIIDTAGLCMFSDGTPETTEWLAKLFSAFYDHEISTTDLLKLGKRVFDTERNFNLRAGISNFEDRLPEFMAEEPLPPTNSIFTVKQEEIDNVFNTSLDQAIKAVTEDDEYYRSFKGRP